jgi:hypothetical protein
MNKVHYPVQAVLKHPRQFRSASEHEDQLTEDAVLNRRDPNQNFLFRSLQQYSLYSEFLRFCYCQILSRHTNLLCRTTRDRPTSSLLQQEKQRLKQCIKRIIIPVPRTRMELCSRDLTKETLNVKVYQHSMIEKHRPAPHRNSLHMKNLSESNTKSVKKRSKKC